MPFIGNQPALSYTSFAKQDFTTSATTSYTLDNPVTNENEIALFINFVRQEPTTAYTASGVNLTLSSATSASDDMYCVFLGKAVQTVNPPNGSVGTAQISSSARTTNLLYPAFESYFGSSPTISTATYTIIAYDAENFDTDSAYDTSTYKFTPQTAGKYFVYAKARINTATDFDDCEIRLLKNTTDFSRVAWKQQWYDSPLIAGITTLNGSTDFVQVDVYQGSGSNQTLNQGYFGAYRIGA